MYILNMAAHHCQHLISVSSVRGAAFAISETASRARKCEHLFRACSNLEVDLDVAAFSGVPLEVHSLQKSHTSRLHFLARSYPAFSYQKGRQGHNKRPCPEHHQNLKSSQFGRRALNLSRGSVRRFIRSMAQAEAEGNESVHVLTVSPSVVGPKAGKMADKLEGAPRHADQLCAV